MCHRKNYHMKTRTPKRAKEERIYRIQVKAWLIGKWCKGCEVLFEKITPATQCHHKFGRVGKLLLWQAGWVPVCADCHEWIGSNPMDARCLGLLCEVGQWNNQSLVK
jgi:hypothetical protein